MTKYILAHDLGTSGNKATLFSEDGKLIASQIYAYKDVYKRQMMDHPLLITTMLHRARKLFPKKEIFSRCFDRDHRLNRCV